MVDMNGFGGGFMGDLEGFKDIIRDSVREVLDARDMGADKDLVEQLKRSLQDATAKGLELNKENVELKKENELLYEEIQALRDELSAVHFKYTQSEVEPPVANLGSVAQPIISNVEDTVSDWERKVRDLKDANFSVSIHDIGNLNYEIENLEDMMTDLRDAGEEIFEKISDFNGVIDGIESAYEDVEKYL